MMKKFKLHMLRLLCEIYKGSRGGGGAGEGGRVFVCSSVPGVWFDNLTGD